jgi:hypothetical protein
MFSSKLNYNTPAARLCTGRSSFHAFETVTVGQQWVNALEQTTPLVFASIAQTTQDSQNGIATAEAIVVKVISRAT